MPRADGRHADPSPEGLPQLRYRRGDYVSGVGRLPRLRGRDEGTECQPDLRRLRSKPGASSRMLNLGAAVIVLLGLPSVAATQPEDPRRSALDDFVAARMLATKCPAWQLNPVEVQSRFSEVGLKPADWQDGGPHARFFDERLSFYASRVSRMSERRACEAAEAAFGPRGQVRRGWMRPK